jgi:hypothetical protein
MVRKGDQNDHWQINVEECIEVSIEFFLQNDVCFQLGTLVR